MSFPVVALLGPRQAGKTTLARQLAAQWDGPVRHFDLEDPDDQARLADPSFVLRPLTGLVVLDEIQTRPDLFPLLRVLADRPNTPARFLILLGSAAPELLSRTAETLAGRVAFHELDGLALDEIAAVDPGAGWLDTRWLRDGFMLREILRRTGAQRGEAFFWSVHTGAELDLLIHHNGRRLGFEIKLTHSPRVTPSMRSSRDALGLDHLHVICHGEGEPWPLAEGITAVPAMCLASPQWRPNGAA